MPYLARMSFLNL